jgi:zinc and cadmium transporter
MSPYILAVLAALSVMLVSLSGVIFTFQALGSWMKSRLTILATFAAGVLTILSYHLIEEALHESSSAAIVAASVVIGAVALELIHSLMPDRGHHHHGVPDHTHSAIDGRRILISDAVHNITDGFVLVPAFLVDWKIGVGATVGIVLHELVQEISEFFVLKEAGYSTVRALKLNFLVSSTILVGVGLAFFLSSFEGVLAILAALAAGGFLSVVLRDLLPSAAESVRKEGRALLHGTAAILGAILMLGVISLTPHEHEVHDEELGSVAENVL